MSASSSARSERSTERVRDHPRDRTRRSRAAVSTTTTSGNAAAVDRSQSGSSNAREPRDNPRRARLDERVYSIGRVDVPLDLRFYMYVVQQVFRLATTSPGWTSGRVDQVNAAETQPFPIMDQRARITVGRRSNVGARDL